MLRNTLGLRSEPTQTRSTKSGPGKCSRFLDILASWLSSVLASAPRRSSISRIFLAGSPKNKRGRGELYSRAGTGQAKRAALVNPTFTFGFVTFVPRHAMRFAWHACHHTPAQMRRMPRMPCMPRNRGASFRPLRQRALLKR